MGNEIATNLRGPPSCTFQYMTVGRSSTLVRSREPLWNLQRTTICRETPLISIHPIMAEAQKPQTENEDIKSQATTVPTSQTDEKSRWDTADSQPNDSKNRNESERVQFEQNARGSSRGKKKMGGRGRGSNVPRGPRGRSNRGYADDDCSLPAPRGSKSTNGVKGGQDKAKNTREQSEKNDQPASSNSEGSEEDDDEEDNDEDEEEDEDDEEKDEEEEEGNDEEEESNNVNDKTEGHENVDDGGAAKDSRTKNSSSDRSAEPSLAKGPPKKQPYVRQVDLPREKLSPADLEAKMAAMALKNAQLMEQKKAADEDAAEYREIELKSQRTFEAQRAQQQDIDAARKAAADRKLKKMQGREWDLEKKEDDWNRSRPYTDPMTNPNPARNTWNSHRGSGSRGRAARGPHARGRGTGRGGRGGPRESGGSESQKTDQPPPHESVQDQSVSNENDTTPST
ncbi:hypothetical protein PCANC_02013 [Puccinia coronata f. sp. avenae]|uniref:Uncharacterized protein n=1 Tax=Puccinia coronata f. sp. avenae TaxID=200324 RepID=A0A2N5W1Z9_9BASI|nr:hypothetical protein PCANC_02013 [Puccinia coronata f. sp. avenae]